MLPFLHTGSSMSCSSACAWGFATFALVLFIKQKTALEMRISDWSSDVCSSDLRPDAKEGAMVERGDDPCDHQRRIVARDGGEEIEIGRASCRERVCQVRVDLGGRRIINKKRQ